MADPIDLITANPDSTDPANFATQADLAWDQLRTAIPQINTVATAFNLNSINDTSATTNTISTGSKTFTVSSGKSFVKGMVLTLADTALPATNSLIATVTAYSGTSLTVSVLQYTGTSGTSIADWTISLSAPPVTPTVTSEIKVTTIAGTGSTNTAVYRFSTVGTNTATADITYASSTTLGDTFTILTAGWYRIKGQAVGPTGLPGVGVTINCTQLSTKIEVLSNINELIARLTQGTSSVTAICDVVVYLSANDVIRFHDDNGGALNTGDANCFLRIQKISLQGVTTSQAAAGVDGYDSEVSIRWFGAVGDGVTDDSAAFVSALASGVKSTGHKDDTYLIKDVTMTGGHFDGNGCVIKPASGALYAVKLTGFNAAFKNVQFQDDGNAVRQTTLNGAQTTGAVEMVVASATGLAVGMPCWVRLNTGKHHRSRITAIASTTVTIADAIPSNAASGNSFEASWGLIRIEGALFFDVDNILVSNGWVGATLGIAGTETGKGSLNLSMSGARIAGVIVGADVHDVNYSGQIWGGVTKAANATGNGATTSYSWVDPVYLKRDITVTVGGVAKVITTDWTFASSTSLTFNSAPANGAAIVINHFVDGYSGYVVDSRGSTISSGANYAGRLFVLDFETGWEYDGAQLCYATQSISDTCQKALSIKNACDKLHFDNYFAGFSFDCVDVTGSSTNIWFDSLYTKRVPTSYTYTGTTGTALTVGSGSTVNLDEDTWSGGDTASVSIAGAVNYRADQARLGSDGQTWVGTLGNLSMNANGDQLGFSLNGFNYISATGGASATLQLQATSKVITATDGVERLRIDTSGDAKFTANVKPIADNTHTSGSAALRWSGVYGNIFYPGAGTVKWTSGSGTPEGAVTAPTGSLYARTDGSTSTTIYFKEANSDDTGWVAVEPNGITTQDVLDMDVVRTDVNGQLIDPAGTVISGSPAVADYTALVALDPAVFESFVVIVESGLNRSGWISNGVNFTPFQGQYVQERSNSSVAKVIAPSAGITWTAADNGAGKVRVTSNAAHGLTTTPAVGASLQVKTTQNNWVAGANHEIATIVSTTAIDLTTTYSSHGVPVFYLAGEEITLKEITLPVLRTNTQVVIEFGTQYTADATGSSRRIKFYLDATELNNVNSTNTTNTYSPFRLGFKNRASVSSQMGLAGYNSSGYLASTLAPIEATITTSAATTLKITYLPASGVTPATNLMMELLDYTLIIRG